MVDTVVVVTMFLWKPDVRNVMDRFLINAVMACMGGVYLNNSAPGLMVEIQLSPVLFYGSRVGH